MLPRRSRTRLALKGTETVRDFSAKKASGYSADGICGFFFSGNNLIEGLCMNRFFVVCAILATATVSMSAQSLEDLNVQIHGYATQGFLYTTNNNVLTTNSSNGSPAWTETVVNVSAQPVAKLRVAVQARYFLLGNYGNAITLDYAMADYKANDFFGVRFGKVKVPSGLFNETQDIDPSYMWSLLPQSVYPIGSRNSVLSMYGGVVYGTMPLGEKMGKLDYRGWGGETVIPPGDGFLLAQTEQGIGFPNGIASASPGGALHWRTPLPGLMAGASDTKNLQLNSAITVSNGAVTGTQTIPAFNQPKFFAKYEMKKILVAYEYSRLPVLVSVQVNIPHAPPSAFRSDQREWYGMGSYKLTDKLTAGVYNSQFFNRSDPLGPARYSKDWTVSGRYDFTEFFFLKAEQHFIQGTGTSYDANLNPGGLKPSTKLTVLKVGVSF